MLFNSPSEVESSPICLAGLLTYASVILGGLPRIFIPVASDRLPSSQRLQLRGSDGFAPSSRTPDNPSIAGNLFRDIES
jgi:hypothetical protein